MTDNYEEKEKLRKALGNLKLTDLITKIREKLEEHIGFESEKEELTNQAILYSITGGKFWPNRKVICYIGPAGIGKTSFVQKLATALDRPLITIPLAGLKDFKDYTILGDKEQQKPSLPAWAIMETIKKDGVGCRNPIILLDELEKVEDEKVQAQLIELFKQYENKEKQNQGFIDPYLEEKIDLAHLTFFATVNDEDALAPRLKNQVLTRYLPDYNTEEKIKILELQREQKKDIYGKNEEFISDESIKYLVKEHIQEGGVRKLNQALSKMIEEYILAQQKNRLPFQGNQKQWIKTNIFPYQESFVARWPHKVLFASLIISFLLLITWIFKKFLLKRNNKP